MKKIATKRGENEKKPKRGLDKKPDPRREPEQHRAEPDESLRDHAKTEGAPEKKDADRVAGEKAPGPEVVLEAFHDLRDAHSELLGHLRESLESRILGTANTQWGFYGTVYQALRSDHDATWLFNNMSMVVHKWTHLVKLELTPVDIRNLLDSVIGRHLADIVLDYEIDSETIMDTLNTAFVVYFNGNHEKVKKAFKTIASQREFFEEV